MKKTKQTLPDFDTDIPMPKVDLSPQNNMKIFKAEIFNIRGTAILKISIPLENVDYFEIVKGSEIMNIYLKSGKEISICPLNNEGIQEMFIKAYEVFIN
jgi:hypothetical protein